MAFFRAAIRGRVPSDIFMYGFVLQSDEDIQLLSDRIKNEWTNVHTAALLADFVTGVAFDNVLVSELSAGTGTVLQTATTPIAVTGSAATNCQPPQCSLAVSILPITGTTKGRFYLPVMGVGVLGPTGRVTGTKRDAHADAWGNFFGALGAASSPARLGIWRTASNTFVGSQGISVGDVIDTQRRRRNKAIETRTTRIVL